MNIKVRSLFKYISVEIQFDHATLDLEVLNEQEAKELAKHFQNAADDILCCIESS